VVPPSLTSFDLHGTSRSLTGVMGGLEASAIFQWRAACSRTVCLPQPWPDAEIDPEDCGRHLAMGPSLSSLAAHRSVSNPMVVRPALEGAITV